VVGKSETDFGAKLRIKLQGKSCCHLDKRETYKSPLTVAKLQNAQMEGNKIKHKLHCPLKQRHHQNNLTEGEN
jgi:hypothetical protein